MNWYVLYPAYDARIFKVDCLDDCLALYNDFGQPNVDFPQDMNMASIDFERMHHHYDGLHLTSRGEFETRKKGIYPNMAGWDCESTLWFRWKFINQEKISDAYDKLLQAKEDRRRPRNEVVK